MRPALVAALMKSGGMNCGWSRMRRVTYMLAYRGGRLRPALRSARPRPTRRGRVTG